MNLKEYVMEKSYKEYDLIFFKGLYSFKCVLWQYMI